MAAAASRWSPATRCSTSTCCRCAGARSRACASSRRPRATPTTTWCASTATSPARCCDPSHISLFRRDCGPGAVRDHLLKQDLIYVGGGSILSLLGVWRAHGIDEDLRAAWQAGVILCRRVGRLAVLVRVGPDGLPPRRQALRRPRLPPALQRRALRGGVQPAAGLPRRAAGRDARRATRRRTARRCTSSARTCTGWCSRARRRARIVSRPWATRSSNCRWRPPISASGRRSRLPPPKTILAMGGGGFSMEPENPALDDYVLGLAGVPMPRICLLPTASGRRRGADPPVPRDVRGARVRADPHLAVPARPPADPAARDTAGAGRRVRRRRLDARAARGLARARPGPDSARVLGVGRRARGAVGGRDVLVRVGDHDVDGRAGAVARARLAARVALGARRRRAGAPAGVPRGGRRRDDPAGLRRRRRRRAVVPRAGTGGGRELAARPARAAHGAATARPCSSHECSRSRTASARLPRSPSFAPCGRSGRGRLAAAAAARRS